MIFSWRALWIRFVITMRGMTEQTHTKLGGATSTRVTHNVPIRRNRPNDGGRSMKLDTVRIVLSCPGCGSDIWVREETGDVRCQSCRDEVSLEHMVALIEPISHEC